MAPRNVAWPSMRPRVALCEPAGRGGIYHYTRALAASLDAAGWEVLLLTAVDEEGGLDEPRYSIARVFRRMRTSPIHVARTLRRFAPDIVHLQSATHPALQAALCTGARFATRAPIVLTAHNVVPKNPQALDVWTSGVLYHRADRVIVHASSLAKDVEERFGIAPWRLHVIPHGESSHLVASPEQLCGETTPTALFFGFLHPEKGLDDLVEAWACVPRKVPGARLVVAGKAEMDVSGLRSRIAELGIEGSVVWREGYVPNEDLQDLFADARAVVLPYREASQSGVLYLAAAFATPVIATKTGALPDVIRDGETGLLVDPCNPPALANALVQLLGNSVAASEMGVSHRAHCADEYSWESVARRTVMVYRQALARHSCRRGVVTEDAATGS